jgi:2-C-methyl-D-erythritol 4-phosphate cytidylyltransferase/2-C-methyl-D-erythritol 2,4-cyclodiphosphate synthase
MTARIRIGQGFDVHRFRAGRPLRLCGHTVEGEVGLEGHSDADVALHAVTDALLGAIARGDIGEIFPPSDPKWRDADSRIFLAGALEMVAASGFRLSNCDLTLIGERPRIAPHRAQLRSSLARLLDIPEDAVSVKATTTEGMGWAGRGEGLVALAVVLLSEASSHG